MKLITVGYAKRALKDGSREQQRMERYATAVSELHMIIFTRKSDRLCSRVCKNNLFLYGTNTRTRLGVIFEACRIARQITKERKGGWVISGQDPFEAGLVAYAASLGGRAHFHIQVHGDVFNPLTYQNYFLQKLRVWVGRWLVKKASGIRVVSKRIKKSLLNIGVPNNKIVVLPIQADLEKFLEIGKNRIFSSGAPLRFLYVGRFSPEKNVPLLLSAFATVSIESNSNLTLLGDGLQRSEIEGLVNDLSIAKQVTIKPWTDDVSSVMAKHDVLCLSSQHEGWGMVLLEAAAAGMPVITTDVGATGESVINGETGLVVPVDDMDSFASAIQKYILEKSLVEEHGRKAYILAKKYAVSDSEYVKLHAKSYFIPSQ